MATGTTEHIRTRLNVGKDGMHIDVGVQELEQAGIHPGEEVLLEVRRYTAEEWIAAGEGRVFTDDEFTAYLKACPPNDDAE
jgi:hypothetical protein